MTNTQQIPSVKYLSLFIFLVFIAYNLGNLIVTPFADLLLPFGGGFFSCCSNVAGIFLVLLLAWFMAKPFSDYQQALATSDLLKNTVIGFMGFVILFSLIWAWEAYTQDTSGKEMIESLNFGESTNNDFWLITGIVLLGPLLEELVFRWLIFSALRDLIQRFLSKPFAVGLAAVISSGLFVSIHGSPEQASQVLPLFVMGVIFALVYQLTGSLMAAFVAHALNNATAILFGLYQIDVGLSAMWLNLWVFAVIALGVVFIHLFYKIYGLKA